MNLTFHEEYQLRADAAEQGAMRALTRLGLIKDEISQREAYRLFGEAKVRSWKNLGLIKRVKVGERNAKVTYSRIELETILGLEKDRRIK